MTITTSETGATKTQRRAITQRTRGQTHGPITRLVSPSDLGEALKPFVFLDYFAAEGARGGFGWHPHSGIATVTVLLEGGAWYEETTGAKGTLDAGAVEWMRAGNGVWHTGGPRHAGRTSGFQLWVALPPELENGPSQSRYVQPGEVPSEGPARVVLGRYGGAQSPVVAPAGMNYLAVRLRAGERWEYAPPAGHTVAWIAVSEGSVRANGEGVERGALAVFERGAGSIEFVAEREAQFVLGSAVPHAHPLVLGRYSVHSSEEALERGEREITRLGERYFGARS